MGEQKLIEAIAGSGNDMNALVRPVMPSHVVMP
jgi:hypothetical protein